MSMVSELPRRPARLLAPVLFTATIFLSASLLFFVQPLFAKIALPVIGGAPAVWTTAMLFFQTVLIGGYLYAHLSTRLLPVPAQLALHMALWATALWFLPPELPEGWRLDGDGSVALQTLGLFALGIGAPFALLSANAPLIQSWYEKSGGPSADDPYFLYGASNLGSLIALLAFPLVAEPFFGALAISYGFAMGFVALGIGLVASGGLAWRGLSAVRSAATPAQIKSPEISTIGFWALLAFLPSSLMLAVTSKISTDVGAIPMVWVIPLALYLLTFVLTFTNRTIFKGKWLEMAALLSATLAISLFLGMRGPHLAPLDIGLLTAAFFIIALWAHRTLYETRPAANNLTVFYVVMSVGGALGGLFNSILAPALFSGLIEGPLTIGLIFLILLRKRLDFRARPLLLALGVGLGLAACLVFLLARIAPDAASLRMTAVAVPSIFLLVAFRPNISAAALGIAVMIGIPTLVAPDGHHFRDRSFFGLHRVLDQNGARLYSNGTTVHGAEAIADLDADRPTPSSYYHPVGPMGQIMQSGIGARAERVGIVGLGVGSLACYARPGQDWHFYEIDRMVDQVARDPTLFTFMSQCAPDVPTHIGDARVVLADQADMRFDILVIDAYSSDAVPMHLTTIEAVALYRARLRSGGLLIFHISNRYYDLVPPLARIADAIGLEARVQRQTYAASDDPGFRPSIVFAMIGPNGIHPEITDDPRWVIVSGDGGRVWTDDRANPLSALNSNPLDWIWEVFGG